MKRSNSNNIKKVVFRVDNEKLKDIRRIAVERESSLTTLFTEGLDLLLIKYRSLLK